MDQSSHSKTGAEGTCRGGRSSIYSEAPMPKLSGIKLAHWRALKRAQIPGELPSQELRLSPAQWVKTLRVSYHISQRRLAELSGITQSQIALIEKGLCEPQLDTLRRVFDALYCDLVVLP